MHTLAKLSLDVEGLKGMVVHINFYDPIGDLVLLRLHFISLLKCSFHFQFSHFIPLFNVHFFFAAHNFEEQ